MGDKAILCLPLAGVVAVVAPFFVSFGFFKGLRAFTRRAINGLIGLSDWLNEKFKKRFKKNTNDTEVTEAGVDAKKTN